MKRFILPLAIAAIPCMSPAVQAQVATASRAAHPPLTLDAAIERAMQHHPEIRAAANEVAAQGGALSQAGTLPNPELELLQEGTGGPNRTSTVQLNIPVELGGKRSARQRAAQREKQIAAQDLQAVRLRIRAETIAAFYELVAANERSRIAGDLVSMAQKATNAAGRRVVAGTLSPVEETRARVAEGGVRIEAVQAGRELERARVRLAAMLGSEQAQVDVVRPGSVDLPGIAPLPQLLAQLEQAPALARARAQVEHRQALADVERSRRTPDMNVVVGTKREDDRRQAVVGLSVPLPLFNRNQGNLLESLRRTDKARDELEAETLRLRSELSDAHARLSAALQEAALIQTDILPGAESAYRAASRGFELGKFSFLEVLDAQRTLFQSKNQYLLAVTESYRASSEIERLVGPIPQARQAKAQEQ